MANARLTCDAANIGNSLATSSDTIITVSLPEDIAVQLASREHLSRLTLEALALEGYRSEKLSTAQLRRMLGFQSRWEVDAFLNQHGVDAEYSRADLERDRDTHRQLGL